MPTQLTLTALPEIPAIEPGDDLTQIVVDGYARGGLEPADGDVLIVAQKVVSKAEGRYARLSEIEPSDTALQLAGTTEKDPQVVELILRESREVIRQRPGVIIVEHRLGYVHANAGIDRSNITSDDDGDPRVLLLPLDPDMSAKALRDALRARCNVDIAVIINDSAGRAWRNGVVGFAIGCAGIEPVRDLVGHPDMFGRKLERTQVAVADELAAAGSLLMGQADEGTPVVLARGIRFRSSSADGKALIRARSEDLFR
ncbi:coenzyme F420-0:L-glutamate ligase [Paraburkholderia rhynchosiae]|uniref:Bifunctional F420 biosynthesis protein FbiB n=1 Tax=Paraburkholderia rhynchosiae TaxID=487049 RepID=A0A2N7W520_9BURK|nr:coenzyme F420-0:L-glutamate ligase [Paraburkholderia rhynchosiae]PMS24488.1 coenzyme F420-0:L-glutamate ligase [Paraburkholderia rhynchosiae]CAB3736142.1 Bifunctional F420 biosynthesis protein FbiB [Paraburkholderia rhynchosiae]